MAQSLKSKISKLSNQYNIDSIIQTATEVRNELIDIKAWDNLSVDEKTEWFLKQCKKYNLTPNFLVHNDIVSRICVEELPCGKNAYFTVFLPRDDQFRRDENDDGWHLEIGGSYIEENNGGIWYTHPGLKGKEKQIAEVMRLHNLGE